MIDRLISDFIWATASFLFGLFTAILVVGIVGPITLALLTLIAGIGALLFVGTTFGISVVIIYSIFKWGFKLGFEKLYFS